MQKILIKLIQVDKNELSQHKSHMIHPFQSNSINTCGRLVKVVVLQLLQYNKNFWSAVRRAINVYYLFPL